MEHPKAHAAPGVLHYIPPNLSLFQPHTPSTSTTNPPKHAVIWIGGLGDTPLSVAYPSTLATALPPTWTLLVASLSSSGTAWGNTTIADDAAELGQLVTYTHQLLYDPTTNSNPRIVLMGHSTGCQDCMAYVLSATPLPPIAAIILQAPVSDREALDIDSPVRQDPRTPRAELDDLAAVFVAQGNSDEMLPVRLTATIFPDVPITARRWLDISSPGPEHAGADDFFSSDFGEERLRGTFGRIGGKAVVLILVGGEDEAVPETVDKAGLVEKWTRSIVEGGGKVDVEGSGVVVGASHNLNGDAVDVVRDLVGRTARFVSRLEDGKFDG